ncbi:MAG: hypothetical protein OHK0026_04470 [Rhodocyclaceae bacterium]
MLVRDDALEAGGRGEPQVGGRNLQALRVLSEVATGLASDSDIEGLLKRFLGTMIRLAGATAGAVRVLTSDGMHLRLVGAMGLPEDVVEHEKLVSLECSLCGSAVMHDRIHHLVPVRSCAEHTGLAFFQRDCHAMVVVPLMFRGRVHGTYNLYFGEMREVPEEVSLVFRSISEHLGAALENARLTRENLRITLMNERQMMANEVHDSLAQTLAYMKMRLALMQDALRANDGARALKFAEDTKAALDGAYAGLRELLSQFRNRMDPLGLLHALESLAKDFLDRTGIELDYENRTSDLNLNVEQEAQVFHIVQEALANVVRHAGATRAQLTVDVRDGHYEITVEDNGKGFFAISNPLGSFDEHPGLRQHLGISIMRERAQRIGGRIELANLRQGGARMRLTVPVPSLGAGQP